jgi:hypothetical protein
MHSERSIYGLLAQISFNVGKGSWESDLRNEKGALAGSLIDRVVG